jgi:hypothetical protein
VGLSTEGDGVLRDGERGKVLFGELDEGLVLDGTGSYETHSVGSVVFGNVTGKVVSLDRVDVLLGAEDGVAEGLSWLSAQMRAVLRELTLEGGLV